MSVNRRPWRVAVDRGGTFTDIVATASDGFVVVRKVPTDAHGSGHDGAIAAIRDIVGTDRDATISADVVASVRCGTTVATNALLERRGEPCALLVTEGFADLLTIGSGERPELFALHVRRDEPLPALVLEIPERVLADGTVRTPLEEDAVRGAARSVRSAGLRSVGVLFLHSYQFDAHERRAGEILREEGVDHVALSHVVAREPKVVPRGSTTAADAYLTPLLRRSLERFRSAFSDDVDVRFMQSHGGLCDVRHALGPRAVLSGPAGGVLAAGRVAAAIGADAVIGFDMGGTSTDVCRWDGEPDLVFETRAGGVRLQVPSLRVETVAAGGGSRLHYDGRRLLVGPESVGADPGPAGYGRGGAAALTDANAVLGRLVPERFPRCFGADGMQAFDVEASHESVSRLAAAAGLSLHAAALAFLRVAVERMAQAIRAISVQQGHDVRTHALVCFGGAGAQHACALAASLGMRRALLHPLGSVLSAWGIGGATSSHEDSEPVLASNRMSWDDAIWASIDAARRRLEDVGRRRLLDEGVHADRIETRCSVTMAYAGADWTLPIALDEPAIMRAAFDARHEQLFGFSRPDSPVELVATWVRTFEEGEAPERAVASLVGETTLRHEDAHEHRDVWFDGHDAPLHAPVFELDALVPGTRVVGPALAVDDVTTVVVEPGWTAVRDASGLLVMDAADVPPAPRADSTRDPLHLSLFANAFMAVAERMGAILERGSFSTSIKERLDFSCAVFDGEGRLVANAPHIPVHLGAMGESVRAIRDARDGTFTEGDAFLTNDPYAGGSHLPDITVVTPVLAAGGTARFFVASRAHHADVGGITPGSMPPLSCTLDEEGVRMHDVHIAAGHRTLDDVLREVLVAGPYPTRAVDERISDLRAQVAAGAEGARGLHNLSRTHGADVVAAYMGHVLDDGCEAMEEMLSDLPDGTSRCDDVLDDGTPLCVAIAVEGNRVVLDFAGTGPRSPGNLNTPRAVSRAAVLYALRVLFAREVPLNEGCLRPVTIRIPDGSLLDPHLPDAVVGGNVETSMRIVDVVLGALGACGAAQGTMNNLAFGRPDGTTYYETIGGGTGAGATFDGASAVQAHMTNTRITDPEVLERRWKVLLRRFGIRRGSGGVGAHTGGDGIVREIEFLEAVRGGMLSERRARGAFGIAGGGPGAPGRNVVIRDGVETALPGRTELDLRPGDVLRIETPGGGGYGVPYESRTTSAQSTTEVS